MPSRGRVIEAISRVCEAIAPRAIGGALRAKSVRLRSGWLRVTTCFALVCRPPAERPRAATAPAANRRTAAATRISELDVTSRREVNRRERRTTSCQSARATCSSSASRRSRMSGPNSSRLCWSDTVAYPRTESIDDGGSRLGDRRGNRAFADLTDGGALLIAQIGEVAEKEDQPSPRRQVLNRLGELRVVARLEDVDIGEDGVHQDAGVSAALVERDADGDLPHPRTEGCLVSKAASLRERARERLLNDVVRALMVPGDRRECPAEADIAIAVQLLDLCPRRADSVRSLRGAPSVAAPG